MTLPDPGNLFCLGVTGAMGCGKSRVCSILEELGALVFYADDVAKELMTTSEDLREGIIKNFGSQSYTAEGQLDREFLAEKVFSNRDSVKLINSLVHPQVNIAFENLKHEAKQSGRNLVVKEAALIFENGGENLLDAVWVVHTDELVRIRRIQERNGWSLEEIHRRTRFQWSPEEKKDKADLVLMNNGSLDDLRHSVQEAFEKLPLRAGGS